MIGHPKDKQTCTQEGPEHFLYIWYMLVKHFKTYLFSFTFNLDINYQPSQNGKLEIAISSSTSGYKYLIGVHQ